MKPTMTFTSTITRGATGWWWELYRRNAWPLVAAGYARSRIGARLAVRRAARRAVR